MPNDPRVKFRSGKVCDKDIDYLRKHPEYLRDHPECRIVFAQHYSGGGSSGRLRSIFEDGTPPPDRPTDTGGGETGGGGATDIIPASLPVKPGLDPGGIAGITIASAIAMGAAAALAEHERRRRLNRGLPVPTDDIQMTNTRRSRPNLNRGGTRVPRAISRANTYSQVPIQATMEAPPAAEISDIRAAIDTRIARPPAPAPAPAAAIQGIRDAVNTPGPAPKLPPPPANRPSSTRQRPTATNIRTSAPGTQTPAPIGSLTPYFDAPQIEMPSLPAQAASGAAKPAPAPEIQGIRDAMGTRLPTPPPPPPPDIPSPPSDITEPPSAQGLGTEKPGRNTYDEILSIYENLEASLNLKLAKPPPKTKEGLAERKKLRQRLTEVEGKIEYIKNYEQRNLITESISRGISTGKIASNRISRDINPPPPVGNNPVNDAFNAARQTNIEMQDIQAHAQQTQAAAEATAEAVIDTLQTDRSAIAEIDRVRAPGVAKTPGGSRSPMVDFEADIQDLLKQARGPRLFEKTMAGVNERFQRSKAAASASMAELQKIGTRNKIQPTTSSKTPETGRATLERARAAGRPMPPTVIETEMRGSSLGAVTPQPTLDLVDMLNAEFESLVEQEIKAGRTIPEVPEAIRKGLNPKMRGQKYIKEEILKRRAALASTPAASGAAKPAPESRGRLSDAEYRQLLEGLPEDEILEMQSLRERLAKLTSDEMPAAERPAPIERPSPPPVERPPAPSVEPLEEPSRPPPAPSVEPLEEPSRPPPTEASPQLELTPAQELNEHLKHLEDFHRSIVESYTNEGRPIPEAAQSSLGEWATKTDVVKQALRDPANANRTITLESGQEITMEEALGDLMARSKEIKRLTKKLDVSPDSELKAVSKAMAETKAPTKSKFGRKGPKPGQERKLTKKTGLLATEEQRLRPTQSGTARERLAQRSQEITSAQQEINRQLETRAAAAAPEARAAAPEVSARSVPAPPEVTARRRMGVPELTAPAIPPEERASFAERRAFFEETTSGAAKSKVKPPIGEPAPSAPPSAPESEISTPSERATMEQTPAERAAFAEELTGRLKKGPARQKAKINIGKPKTTANPLDIFVSPQHRNLPNTELNPRAKSFRGTLTEISARVPRLVPSRTTLISMGAEGGSMVGGFAAGYFSAQAMNDHFAKNPPKNLGEQYGQALATSFVGMAVGSITQQVLSAVIRRGVNYALTGEVAALAGFTSGAGTAFLTSIGEAALFTAVGVTTQMLTTKFLEDAGFNHAISRSVGAAVSTYALAETEYYLWAAKSGGGLNLAADASLIVSEAMIIGFGIYQTINEYIEGAKQDEEEEEYQAQLAENKRLNEERDRVIDTTLRRNNARQAFMIAYEAADYDFDKALAAMTPQQRIDLGQSADTTDPNSLVAFRAQIEAAFDPLLDTSTSEGYKPDPRPLSREEQLKKDTYNAYITWYIDSLSGKNPPPFDVNSEGAQLLSRETGGTWMSAANVHAQTSITMARRTNPLIQNAQEEIVNAFHKEHKTIEEMPPDIVQYADLDPGFRGRYNAYIIAEAQTQIYMEYNTAGITYNDMDPKLVAIANRDAEFRSAVDTYYQVIANQMRDYNLTIQEAVHLNALAANGEQTEIGKLNEARTKIIQQHQAANQEQVDRYNASILQEISAYGDNFEAIIRNINDQALLTGHTFLYAATPADLYRQLHMEMPELELVDPDTDGPDAPLPGPSKGRKIGDTALYGYRYKLTDEQNQELDEQARIGVFADNETQMAAAAAIIYERDRYLFEETDAEKAARENLTLDEYYEKYGIPVEQPIIEWDRSKGNPKEDGKYRFPDGTIETWKNGFRVKVDTTNKVAPPAITKYDPTLSSQPDGQIEMPDGAVRTYKDGLVTSVKYPSGTKATEMLTPDEINAKERPPTTPTTPTEPTGTITYEQLQQQYPETYKNLLRKYGDDPTGPAQIEATLRKAYNAGFNETTGETSTGLTPGGQPVEPITREPTYEELKVMYPDKYTLFSSTYKSMHSQASQEIIDKQTELYLRQQYSKNPVPLPPPQPVTPTEPKQRVLFSGDRKMPDGSTRVYVNGKVIGISYPAGFPANQMMKADKASLTRLNDQEGLYYVEVEPTPVTPTQPTDPTTLKQGSVTMPDGSRRTYKNGLVIEVYYPPNMADLGNKNPTQINDAEGIRNSTWIPEAPVVTPVEPVVDRDTLLQGRVTWSDRSTRTYIDGKVVSVQYPDGKTGPNINEINAAEGVQLAKDPGARPKDWMDRFLEEQAQQQKAKNDADAAAAAAAAAENPEPDIYVNPGANPRYIASKQTPAPANTTAQALNLAVAPARAPATTSMPEDTTPGVANP